MEVSQVVHLQEKHYCFQLCNLYFLDFVLFGANSQSLGVHQWNIINMNICISKIVIVL